MNKPLSPAAQAVLDAYDNSHFDDDIGDRVAIAAQAVLDAAWQLSIINCKSIAAALRAAAHHLQRSSPWPNDVEGIGIDWCTSELHDIAHELEGQS